MSELKIYCDWCKEYVISPQGPGDNHCSVECYIDATRAQALDWIELEDTRLHMEGFMREELITKLLEIDHVIGVELKQNNGNTYKMLEINVTCTREADVGVMNRAASLVAADVIPTPTLWHINIISEEITQPMFRIVHKCYCSMRVLLMGGCQCGGS